MGRRQVNTHTNTSTAETITTNTMKIETKCITVNLKRKLSNYLFIPKLDTEEDRSNTGEETSLFPSPPAHTVSRLCTVLPQVSSFRKGICLQTNFLELNYFAHIGPCFGRTKNREQCSTTTKKTTKDVMSWNKGDDLCGHLPFPFPSGGSGLCIFVI